MAVAVAPPVEIDFEDLHEGFAGNPDFYYATNEDPHLLYDMVKDLGIERAAGICSGGEVAFFTLLPAVKRDITLVDHSYASLSIAMMKYLLVKERGWREAHEFWTKKRHSTELVAILSELAKRLPAPVRKAYLEKVTALASTSEIGRYWQKAPVQVLDGDTSSLDRISFVHGDMADLLGRAPFDLYYVSNAFGHINRDRHAPVAEAVGRLVRPGGYVLASERPRDVDWPTVASTHGNWTYYLLQVGTP